MLERKLAISVSLDSTQIERLDEISRRTKIPRSVLVREGVQTLLDSYDSQLDLPLKVEEE